MLGFVSRYGASKGMVAVPDLAGLTSEAAEALVAQRGLKLQSKTSRNSSTQNNRVSSQTIAPGTLVDYESPVSFVFDVLIPDTITFGNCQAYDFSDSGNSCGPGTYTNFSRRTTFFRRLRTVTSVDKPTTSEWVYDCGSSTTPASGDFVDGSCGYFIPVASCTPDNYYVIVPWGTCSGGRQTRVVGSIDSRCNVTRTTESRCCQTSTTVVYGDWIRDTHSRVRSVTTTDTRCNVSVTYETVCTTRTTVHSCGACTRKSPFRRTCSTTTINSDCSTSSGSVSQAC
jgi:hypothetical protein